jgi:hypothetical protein
MVFTALSQVDHIGNADMDLEVNSKNDYIDVRRQARIFCESQTIENKPPPPIPTVRWLASILSGTEQC